MADFIDDGILSENGRPAMDWHRVEDDAVVPLLGGYVSSSGDDAVPPVAQVSVYHLRGQLLVVL